MTTPTADGQGWRPIESAPRDGTEIIAYGIFSGDYGYSEDTPGWTGIRWVPPVYWSGKQEAPARWQLTLPTAQYCRSFVPTHWMALPSPPTSGDQT